MPALVLSLCALLAQGCATGPFPALRRDVRALPLGGGVSATLKPRGTGLVIGISVALDPARDEARLLSARSSM